MTDEPIRHRRTDVLETTTSRLIETIRQAIEELETEHRPEHLGGDKYGCVMCWPHDPSWPCVTSQIVDDLRTAVGDVK